MYNGIGLQTARGSGTNGYIQTNKAFVRKQRDRVDYKSEEEIKKLDAQMIKQPNREILDHERKRKVELKCMEMMELMDEQGYSTEEIDNKVTLFRKMLMDKEGVVESSAVEKDEFGRPIEERFLSIDWSMSYSLTNQRSEKTEHYSKLTHNLQIGKEEEFLAAEVIYNSYNIDTAVERERDISYHPFCIILQRVFNLDAKRKFNALKQKQAVYNLQWQQQNHLSTPTLFDQLKITNILKDLNIHVHESTDHYVKFKIPTGWLCNGNEVLKEVVLNSDMTYDLYIRGQKINLHHNYIDGTYCLDSKGLCEVLAQVKCIQLCRGVTLQTKDYKTHTNILQEVMVKQGDENSSENILRSKLCKQFSVINNRKKPNCQTCQRLIIKSQKSASTPSVKETVNTTVNETLKSLMPTASETTLAFLEAQVRNSNNKCKKQNRWDGSIINECLNLFSRSPEGYKSLMKSGLLLLPSPSLLMLYKNSIQQTPGFHENIFKWMHEEANRMSIPQVGRIGGILIDEMSIQEKIEIVKKGDSLHTVGFVELGEESEAVDSLKSGSTQKELGTHVLQMIFMGLTGFRFPIAHFVSRNLTASHIYILFWEAVNILQDFNFSVKYVCMDGAMNNRSFMHIHFPDKLPINHNMISKCPSDPSNHMIFLMDPSHTFKKVRNNVIKSGNAKGHTRLLTLQSGTSVQWSMWVNAYKWDCKNPVQIHYRLTNEHIFPSNSSKMRNKLAEDVLDNEMLNLMMAYRASLVQNGEELEGAIEFLQKTSKLISIFRDKRPVHLIEDQRLKDLKDINTWIHDWAKYGTTKTLMSAQCMEDIQSTILGFVKLCEDILLQNNGWSITPAMINSDPIENHFCQQRGKFNGLNTNPTALQYRRNSTSIVLGQTAISRKSNTGGISSNSLNFKSATKKTDKGRKRSTNYQSTQPIKVIRL